MTPEAMARQLTLFFGRLRELGDRVVDVSRALRSVGDEVFEHRAEIQRLRAEVEALKTQKR